MKAVKFAFKHFVNSIKKSVSLNTKFMWSKPLQINIQPNKRCNAKCIMCDCWKVKEDYITYKDILATLQDTRKWIGPNYYVSIVGGESLIFKGIFDIFKYCSKNDIICMTHTNGISLSERVCDKIIDSGLPYLSVSLDSHIPEIHNHFRGANTAFSRSVEGLKYLSENSSMTLGITSIIMRDNIETFSETLDFFLTLPIHRFNFQPIRVWTEELDYEKWPEYEYWIHDQAPLDRAESYLLKKKKEDNRILNSKEDILGLKEYFNNPQSQVKKGRKKCTIGYNKLTIDYLGDVYLGCIYHNSIGNIKSGISIKKMWKSKEARVIRNKMANCQIPCTDICYKKLSLKQKIQKLTMFVNSGLFQN